MNIFSAGVRAAVSRLLIVLAMVSYCFFSVGQSRDSELKRIDRYIREADSLSFRSQTGFHLTKFLRGDRTYREHWYYSEDRGRIVIFQISYIVDSVEFSEVYYVDRGRLVCSEEYEKVSHSVFEDELRWGGIYYFVSAVPRRVVFLGKKAADKKQQMMDRENPALEILGRFQKRYDELRRHMPMLPR